jgi:RimJ/RimL family protein N-acetyltransferase
VSVILRQPLTLAECQQVRVWRNAPDVLPMLRTGEKTEAEQDAFYRNVILNPTSVHRYYAIDAPVQWTVRHDGQASGTVFVGMGGLTYINRERKEAEISLLLGPLFRRNGYGRAAVQALLTEAFGPLGLDAVIGECYAANPARTFWAKLVLNTNPARNLTGVRTVDWQMHESLTWRWRKAPVAA